MSLFTRTIGLFDNPEEGKRIPIHGIQSLLSELDRGRLTFEQVATTLELDASEQVDLGRLISHILAALDKHKFSSRVFNYLVLGESQVTGRYDLSAYRDYTDETLFWEMLESEAPLLG